MGRVWFGDYISLGGLQSQFRYSPVELSWGVEGAKSWTWPLVAAKERKCTYQMKLFCLIWRVITLNTVIQKIDNIQWVLIFSKPSDWQPFIGQWCFPLSGCICTRSSSLSFLNFSEGIQYQDPSESLYSVEQKFKISWNWFFSNSI